MTTTYRNVFISAICFLFILRCAGYGQWQKLNLPSVAKVNALVISDSNIFAGTDGDGIFLSTDNGDNWRSANAGLESSTIHAIFINGTRIFAGTDAGASISMNNGITWSTIDSGLSGKGVWSFASSGINPGDSVLLAGTWSGIYSSSNDGTTWEATSVSSTIMPVHTVVAHGSVVLAATLADEIFYSQDNGFFWIDTCIQYKNPYSGIKALIPIYSIAAIDTNFIAGADSGSVYYASVWEQPSFISNRSVPAGNDPILCFAIHNGVLYAGNSVGDIYSSSFGGTYWIPAYHFTPAIHGIYSIALNDIYIFAGTESGVWRLRYAGTDAYRDVYQEAPTGFALRQNYPNPLNPSTNIEYRIANLGFVSLRVFDVLGREVAALVNEIKYAGTYSVKFDGSNLPGGTYFYRLRCGPFVATKKLLLLK